MELPIRPEFLYWLLVERAEKDDDILWNYGHFGSIFCFQGKLQVTDGSFVDVFYECVFTLFCE